MSNPDQSEGMFDVQFLMCHRCDAVSAERNHLTNRGDKNMDPGLQPVVTRRADG